MARKSWYIGCLLGCPTGFYLNDRLEYWQHMTRTPLNYKINIPHDTSKRNHHIRPHGNVNKYTKSNLLYFYQNTIIIRAKSDNTTLWYVNGLNF